MTVQTEVYIPARRAGILVTPRLAGEISEQWFDPLFWGQAAKPVSAGGRGGAWFIESSHGAMVLREYRRGGLVASLSESSYVFTGERAVRSFAEFRLLARLQALGLPVPPPVAAYYRRVSAVTYKARLLVERLKGVHSLAEHPDIEDTGLWNRVGRVIRQFHDAGLNHVDLNCHNILISGNQVYLIDFDRCRLMPPGRAGSDWRAANLARLERSCAKIFPFWPEAGGRLWKQLCEGYRR